jgi:hypothetical protein
MNLVTFEQASNLMKENKSFRMNHFKTEWNIIKVTNKQITIVSNSDKDIGYKFNYKSYTFKFDGIGYIRQKEYLTIINL